MATRFPPNDAAERGRDFFRRLARQGPEAPIYVISGEETFLVDEALDRIESALFPNGRDDFNVTLYQGGECTGAEIVAAADSMPMFAARRLVLVRGADRLPAAEWKPIGTYAGNPNPTTVLVLEVSKLDERIRGVKDLLAASQVASIQFPHLSERDLLPWIMRRAQHRGLELGRDVPEYLVDAVGSSLHQLALAIEKIDLFLGPGEAPRRVPGELAAQIVADGRSRSIFELMEEVTARRADRALDCLHRLLLHGESPVAIVGLMAHQVRQLLLLRRGQAEGYSGRELAAYAGMPMGRMDAALPLARRFQIADLEWLVERVMRTDHALKSSRLRDSLHVERLILQVCYQGTAARA